jgi:hypothetical protein
VRLHIGHWTDGSYDDYRDGEYVDVDAGVYGIAVPVNIMACEPRKPQDEPSNMTATLQYRRTQVIGAVVDDIADWIEDAGENVENILAEAAPVPLP